MRRFLIPAVAAAALALADPAPAGAQIIVRGNPAFIVPDPMPPRPLPRVLVPGGSGFIPYSSGSPVEFALNRAFWMMAAGGYGPYASYYAPVPATRVVGAPARVVPAQWVQPLPVNPGMRNGWIRGGAMGGGKGWRLGEGPLSPIPQRK
jgi:hypothetical protein